MKTTIYFLRELTGTIIVISIIGGAFFTAFNWIGFAAAAFHAITWLFVSVRLLALKPVVALVILLVLVAGVSGLSILLLRNLYALA